MRDLLSDLLDQPQPLEPAPVDDDPRPLSIEAEQARTEADVLEHPPGSDVWISTAAVRRLRRREAAADQWITERRRRVGYGIGWTFRPRQWQQPSEYPLNH